MTTSGNWTHAGYRDLLAALLERGYASIGYDQVQAEQKHVIVRHDLDMSLQAAEPIAIVENELGIRAHYFVLVHTEFYNPFSARSGASLERILSLGHEVGLHLDASLYDNDLAAVEDAAQRECALLESATGVPVRFISFHRPADALLGYAKQLAGRRHAYEPCFFRDIGYVSDSRGGWHYGHPMDHSAVRDGRAFQLLTHPIWWSAKPGGNPVEKLDRYVADRVSVLKQELAANCEPYRDSMGKKSNT